MKIAKNITELIGNTPLVRLNKASKASGANIIAKCEFMNPTSSVKDRIGFNMIRRAMEDGTIKHDTTIIEPTSGNTGIALAANCAALDLKLILTMPESMSIERRKLLKAFGAELVLTPAALGMSGAIAKSEELSCMIPNSVVLQQFKNRANPEIHMLTTAQEILRDTDKSIDAFVAAVGTGGTLSGVSKVLKEQIPNIAIFAVEPLNSAVLSGESAGPHAIQGIGAGFIPDTLDVTVYGEIIKVSNEDAIKTAKMLAKDEGLLVGISAGANVFAIMQIASREEFKGKTLLTILCDTGERYLSTDLFDE
ncbi:cysteine synthase [Sulfurimonas denitrificans DSM 1251]|uniref:Cysteine synthase n=1 Tax=Sulfurimonas denitrificans (strain ATCC 33889 / DSM 1251) TaxID=326298 RepID=Q30TG7_SULDN|nr:cysteine synthase A [Sulfurimonas denitrificans]ABB43714.1 cysteine synthase [Sulfurimonas denitrificans DSM 1251]MDD3442737.1 cysteine synthase A [Sulfurimonas denitrificans]